jgi:membrane protein DedA with SNARE-associated domain
MLASPDKVCYYGAKVLETEGGPRLVSNLIEALTAFIQNLYVITGLAGIVLAMAIESCCIPLPSEIIMPLAGAMLATEGQAAAKHLAGINPASPLWLNLILLALAGSLGSLLGSIVAYWIGSAGGRPLMLKYGRYVLISQHDADRADRFFQRWGAPTAFFSRMLPVVRTYISLPAGITKMSFGKFCLYTFLGSLPWCLLLAFIGYELGNNYSKISGPLHYLDVVVVVVVVLLAALYIWRHIRNDRRARAEHAAAAAAQSNQQPPNPWGQPQFQAQQPVNQAVTRPPFQNQQVPPSSPQQSWGQPVQQPWGRPSPTPQGQPPQGNNQSGQNWR